VIAKNLFCKVAKSRQLFVISRMPSKRQEIVCGMSENIGEKHSMIIKKIVMIEPTDKMERVESKTMLERSKCDFGASSLCDDCAEDCT
jgi:hypothetical protein